MKKKINDPREYKMAVHIWRKKDKHFPKLAAPYKTQGHLLNESHHQMYYTCCAG
jgi:hypothetical protein